MNSENLGEILNFLLKNLWDSEKNTTFAPAFKKSKHWRDGRVVDYSSLENYRTERYRGFESLSLRKEFNELIVGLFFVIKTSFSSSIIW